MTVVVACQVFSRYVLNNSLFWSEEVARIILVWLTFLAATVAYYQKLHPGVDTVWQRLPRRLRNGAAFLSWLAGMVLFSVMILWGAKFAWFVRLQITPALNIPKWVIMAVVPAAGVIFMVHALAGMAKALSDNRSPHDH